MCKFNALGLLKMRKMCKLDFALCAANFCNDAKYLAKHRFRVLDY